MTDEAIVYAAALKLGPVSDRFGELEAQDAVAHRRAVRAVQRYRDWRAEETLREVRTAQEAAKARGLTRANGGPK